MNKKRLCFFLHYFPGGFFPLYVQYYVNELSLHFDEVRMITNYRVIKEQPAVMNPNVQIHFVENEGYDFGKFYKGFLDINPMEYSCIACVNDSNILLNRLDFLFKWDKSHTVDFWGLVDSHEAPWFSTHPDSYHIQSHFIVFNTRAIALIPEFFEQIQPEQIFQEKDLKTLRRKVINGWELGMSQFLLNNKLTCASCFNSLQLLQKYKSKGKNVTHVLYEELLAEGYPLLKKKVALEKGWKLFGKKSNPKKLIKQFGYNEWKLEEALNEIL
jgi:hypothetical protein